MIVAGPEVKELTVKYFVLLAGYGEMPGWDDLTPEEQEAGMAKHVAFDEACAARPGVEISSSEALGGRLDGYHTAHPRRRDDDHRRPVR